jgi:hypothetical protein
MARLVTRGWELNSSTSGVEFDICTAGATITNTQIRGGAFSGHIVPSGAGQSFVAKYATATTAGPIFVRAYINVAAFPTTNHGILLAYDGGSNAACAVVLNHAGSLSLIDGGGSPVTIGTSGTISTGVWYCVEMTYNASTLALEARLDGIVFASGNGVTVNSSNQVLFGTLSADATLDIYYDDAAVNDSTGAHQTSYPGPGAVTVAHPNNAGESTQWTKAGSSPAATNWQSVNEFPPDDGTTYVARTTTTNKTDWYLLDDSKNIGINANSIINVVSVGFRGGATSTTATARDLKLQLETQSGGTAVQSADLFVNVNGWVTNSVGLTGGVSVAVDPLVTYTDPQAGGSWTFPLFTNARVGIVTTTSSVNEIRVSNVWATIDYIPWVEEPMFVAHPYGQAINRAANF